ENKPAIPIIYTLNIDGTSIKINSELIYTSTDPVKGEVVKPCMIVPELMGEIENPIYILTNNEARTINVKLKTNGKAKSGICMLAVPRGWRVEPINHTFSLSQKEEKLLSFKIFPPPSNFTGYLRAAAVSDGVTYSQNVDLIEYDHIPTQLVLDDAQAKLIKTDLVIKGNKIAYIMGAGDEVPECLELIGYDVTNLTESEINLENLKQYDAVLTGIRAFNTNKYLEYKTKVLHEYVNGGGTVLVQYNTNHRLVTKDIAPYPIKLSRDRVTEENASVQLINKEHVALNSPNKITTQDFQYWIQERGLYFPNEWDENFVPLIASNDTNEKSKTGSILVAEYGDGHFVYTGISWFRQLPAGVPGAYRLIANLISLGN
ncbi:MAG: LmbE family protein, partial [Bacteroidia bacterium]|nr:LmbE family protein [Bacteroidia bacterium]